MSHPLYHTTRWRKRRAAQLKTEPLCRYCYQQGRTTAATVADHIEPHRGDPEKFWRGELQSLCVPCHNSVKQREEKTGTIAGCNTYGIPLDSSHHWHSHMDPDTP